MTSELGHTRPALGQDADLGTLYDAHKDTFVGANIIRGDPTPAAISVEKIGSQRAQILASVTAQDRLSVFGVDNELAASLVAGSVLTSGSALYLHQPQQKESATEGAVHYEILTESVYLNIANPDLRDRITTDTLKNIRSTHIVTGITYGVKFILAARCASSDANLTQDDMPKRLSHIKTLLSQHESELSGSVGGLSPGSASQKPCIQGLDGLMFSMFSDFEGMKVLKKAKPATVELLIRQIPNLLDKTDHGRGVPLTYHLMPLEYLRMTHGLQIGPRLTVHKSPEWVLEELISIWEKWTNMENPIKNVMNEIDSIKFMFKEPGLRQTDKAGRQLEQALKAKGEFRLRVSSTLDKFRAGRCPIESLEGLMSEHLLSDFSPDKTWGIIAQAIERVGLRKDLATYGGKYHDYEGVQYAISASNSIYVLFFTEDMRRDAASWKESQDIIKRLLHRNPGDYNVAVAECQPNEVAFSRPRISYYSRGEVKIENMMESMDLVDQCFIRRDFKSDAPESLPAPQQRRLVRLPCPHSSCDNSLSHDWTCYHCRCIMEYHERFFYCECGRTRISSCSWQCNADVHGDKFVAYDPMELEPKLNALQSYKEMNTLILGESGVGKSTFINAFYNYMMFDTLDAAMDHERLEYAIPSSFTLQYANETDPDGGFVQCKVKIGNDAEEQDGSTGQSATQSPTVYRLQIGDRIVRLIDTPGIGDTRGEEFDKLNMSKVLSTLNRFSSLHGIMILVKPNNARLNVIFRFCVEELLTHLHREAVRNIVWGFTNTRQSNYTPGDTLSPLTTLLKKHEGLGLRLTTKKVFCFDSESFRCLAAQKQAGYTMDNLDDFRKSWDRSTRTTKTFLEHVESLEPHQVKSTLSINRAREVISQLTQPMADITDNIERTIRLNQDKIKELSSARSKGKSLEEALHFERIEIDDERLENPRTVCKHPDCVDLKEVAGVKRPIYKSFCHDPCTLSDVDEDVVGHASLVLCATIRSSTGCCYKCQHHWQQHLHIRYTQTERVVRDIDPDVQAKIAANASSVAVKKEATKALKKRVKDLETTLKEFQDAAIKFGLYLKKKSISPYNDAMIEYLDFLINDEKRQIAHCNANGVDVKKNEERLDALVQSRSNYEQRIKILEREMSKSDESYALLDEQGVDDQVQKLYNLKHFGKNLKAMREMVDWSKTAGFREQELRPRIAKNMSTLSWLSSPVANAASAVSNGLRGAVGAVSSAAGGLFGKRGANARSGVASQSPSSSRRQDSPIELEFKVEEEDSSGTYQPRGTKRGPAQAGLPTNPGRYNLRYKR
ncbi:hypothetical protein PG996_007860 [Apiospora saccharicola]|uniref:G domain-containing protein n=1 Tax=Apiospora saccharicola TaxID=335842 RepID=A0ABR1UWB3_9PEZI